MSEITCKTDLHLCNAVCMHIVRSDKISNCLF